jgi:hypothetical protein
MGNMSAKELVEEHIENERVGNNSTIKDRPESDFDLASRYQEFSSRVSNYYNNNLALLNQNAWKKTKYTSEDMQLFTRSYMAIRNAQERLQNRERDNKNLLHNNKLDISLSQWDWNLLLFFFIYNLLESNRIPSMDLIIFVDDSAKLNDFNTYRHALLVNLLLDVCRSVTFKIDDSASSTTPAVDETRLTIFLSLVKECSQDSETSSCFLVTMMKLIVASDKKTSYAQNPVTLVNNGPMGFEATKKLSPISAVQKDNKGLFRMDGSELPVNDIPTLQTQKENIAALPLNLTTKPALLPKHISSKIIFTDTTFLDKNLQTKGCYSSLQTAKGLTDAVLYRTTIQNYTAGYSSAKFYTTFTKNGVFPSAQNVAIKVYNPTKNAKGIRDLVMWSTINARALEINNETLAQTMGKYGKKPPHRYFLPLLFVIYAPQQELDSTGARIMAVSPLMLTNLNEYIDLYNEQRTKFETRILTKNIYEDGIASLIDMQNGYTDEFNSNPNYANFLPIQNLFKKMSLQFSFQIIRAFVALEAMQFVNRNICLEHFLIYKTTDRKLHIKLCDFASVVPVFNPNVTDYHITLGDQKTTVKVKSIVLQAQHGHDDYWSPEAVLAYPFSLANDSECYAKQSFAVGVVLNKLLNFDNTTLSTYDPPSNILSHSDSFGLWPDTAILYYAKRLNEMHEILEHKFKTFISDKTLTADAGKKRISKLLLELQAWYIFADTAATRLPLYATEYQTLKSNQESSLHERITQRQIREKNNLGLLSFDGTIYSGLLRPDMSQRLRVHQVLALINEYDVELKFMSTFPIDAAFYTTDMLDYYQAVLIEAVPDKRNEISLPGNDPIIFDDKLPEDYPCFFFQKKDFNFYLQRVYALFATYATNVYGNLAEMQKYLRGLEQHDFSTSVGNSPNYAQRATFEQEAGTLLDIRTAYEAFLSGVASLDKENIANTTYPSDFYTNFKRTTKKDDLFKHKLKSDRTNSDKLYKNYINSRGRKLRDLGPEYTKEVSEELDEHLYQYSAADSVVKLPPFLKPQTPPAFEENDFDYYYSNHKFHDLVSKITTVIKRGTLENPLSTARVVNREKKIVRAITKSSVVSALQSIEYDTASSFFTNNWVQALTRALQAYDTAPATPKPRPREVILVPDTTHKPLPPAAVNNDRDNLVLAANSQKSKGSDDSIINKPVNNRGKRKINDDDDEDGSNINNNNNNNSVDNQPDQGVESGRGNNSGDGNNSDRYKEFLLQQLLAGQTPSNKNNSNNNNNSDNNGVGVVDNSNKLSNNSNNSNNNRGSANIKADVANGSNQSKNNNNNNKGSGKFNRPISVSSGLSEQQSQRDVIIVDSSDNNSNNNSNNSNNSNNISNNNNNNQGSNNIIAENLNNNSNNNSENGVSDYIFENNNNNNLQNNSNNDDYNRGSYNISLGNNNNNGNYSNRIQKDELGSVSTASQSVPDPEEQFKESNLIPKKKIITNE